MSSLLGNLGPLPLVVGVTGHRDLREADTAGLTRAIEKAIGDLREMFPRTPLIILSALAEGADRLVAEVAVRHGATLVAALPMDAAEYEKDFHAAGSLADFRRLLAVASSVIVMDGAAESPAGADRVACYARVGIFIVRRCQVLIALWDGDTTESDGGTAQVVRFKLHGVPPSVGTLGSVAEALDVPEPGPVFHIVTPRVRESAVHGEPFTLVKLFPPSMVDDAEPGELGDEYNLIARFNHHALTGAAKASAHVSSLSPIPPAADGARRAALQRIDDHHSLTDFLATRLQGKTLLALRFVMMLGLIALAAHQFHIRRWPPHTLWLSLFLGCLVVAYAVYGWAIRTRNYQNLYQDYRALAEALRVQYFWLLAGVPDSVHDHYLRKHRGELRWIRAVLANWSLGAPPAGDTPDAAGLDAVLTHWVRDQHVYFSRRIPHQERRHHALELGKYTLLALTVLGFLAVTVLNAAPGTLISIQHERVAYFMIALTIAGAIHVIWRAVRGRSPSAKAGDQKTHAAGVGVWVPALIMPLYTVVVAVVLLMARGSDDGVRDHIAGALELLVIMAAVMATVMHFYAEKLGFADHLRQYARMRQVFGRAEALLTDMIVHGRHAEARAVILELGKEALAENADWLVLHRERPVEVPHN